MIAGILTVKFNDHFINSNCSNIIMCFLADIDCSIDPINLGKFKWNYKCNYFTGHRPIHDA